MTVAEFKAWIEGFSENIVYAPDGPQWGKIKSKIADLEEIKPGFRESAKIPAPLARMVPGYALTHPTT